MANKVAAEFQTESDFEAFTKDLRKEFRESTLEGEMDNHLAQSRTHGINAKILFL